MKVLRGVEETCLCQHCEPKSSFQLLQQTWSTETGSSFDVPKTADTYLSQIETSTIAAVVVIAVHVQDLLAINRKQSREDAFSETGALEIVSAEVSIGALDVRAR